MNPARAVYSAAPAAAAASSSSSAPRSAGSNVGQFEDGKGNPSKIAKENAFHKGLFNRYLMNAPKEHQIKFGVVTLMLAGVGLFFLSKPKFNPGLTRTKEWEKAEVEFLNKQRVSPAHKSA